MTGSAPPPADPEACSFCQRPRAEVQMLVAGPGVSICDTCVELCNQILHEARAGQGPIELPVAHARHDARSPTWRRWLRRVF